MGAGRPPASCFPGSIGSPRCCTGGSSGRTRGGVHREQLDYYLDEFTFRFNRCTSRHRGLLFYRLLQHAMQVEPIPYAKLVKGVRGLRPKGHHNL